MSRPEPRIMDQVFDPEQFSRLQKVLQSIPLHKMGYDERFGRYNIHDHQMALLTELAKKLTSTARIFFGSKTLVPSLTSFGLYKGPTAQLDKHKDNNACTYVLDYCVFQRVPWDIWVEDRPYTLHENQALGFYGNDQFHWREAFPQPETNFVGMIFFNFVEPEHWYYAKGPDFLSEIRAGNAAIY